ncbi:3,4-dihydroxy-2-butanone-4-phosphate synthase [Nocardia sp. FBN12]|uniref:3,4-dihydroxy-2-butanone-4-phosphate synthase n=1 Tax=Nocardia sp. FBN12 TaxID=3419766 RepID=UPI003D057C20
MSTSDAVPSSTVSTACAELRRGRTVLVVDDNDRRTRATLVLAAQFATPEALAFMIRHTSGLVCAALTQDRADLLDLPAMAPDGPAASFAAAFTVTCDLAAQTGTGISAHDRAGTLAALADPALTAHQLTRPGHVQPVRVSSGGVLDRPEPPAAASDLCRLAGLEPVGVLCELVDDDDAGLTCGPAVGDFAREHDLAVIAIADIIAHRRRTEPNIGREAAARIPTPHGEFTAIGYRDLANHAEHVAFVLGDLSTAAAVPVHVHAECVTGDVFGSRRCGCAEQLHDAMSTIAEHGRGAVIYLRAHQRRLNDQTDPGTGTRDAIDGCPASGDLTDRFDYFNAAHILSDLQVTAVWLLSTSTDATRALAEHGLRIVSHPPVEIHPNTQSRQRVSTPITVTPMPLPGDFAHA